MNIHVLECALVPMHISVPVFADANVMSLLGVGDCRARLHFFGNILAPELCFCSHA